ncbi:MAG: metallophosphoesterase [Cyclobacteriaceae bacterium]
MKVPNKLVYKNLEQLFNEAESETLGPTDKWVIFSDLHMGDGSSTDDFKSNSDLFEKVLGQHYLPEGYKLFLNGDVEELQRFSINKIVKKWSHIYDLFKQFTAETSLVKSIGNHDLELSITKNYPFDFRTVDAYRLMWKDQPIFLFHGHQASKNYQKHNQLIGFTLKFIADPLGIKSYSVSHDSKKQYNIEKRVYHLSSFKKWVSVIGHTHRPLFESLHKVDRLKFLIEQLCRDYMESADQERQQIKESIKAYKKELKKHYKENESTSYQNYVYNSIFHIPCLFNSGTVIGKRGMTCLEIEGGVIRLVHWFDKNISEKFLQRTGYQPQLLEGTDYYRMVINQEHLDYVFSRIKLLS